MKNKEQIKQDIYELAQKISRASSEKFLLETTRELFEYSVLLKHADEEIQAIPKTEEKTAPVAEEPAKVEPKQVIAEQKQTPVDLFSIEEASPITTTNTTRITTSAEPKTEEKPAAKTPKEPKKKKDESVAEKLQHNKISDLKSSIGINEKFQFINELFEGNMKEYNVAVDQINSFANLVEAESYIDNLEGVYKWQADNTIAENFKELVERRFA